MDARSAGAVREALRRESRCLLLYLSEARPWAPSSNEPASGKLESLAAEQRRALASLARLLQRSRRPLPYLGAFPADFTTINDVALDSVWKLLAEDARRSVHALEAERDAAADAEAASVLGGLLEIRRRHAEIIAGMTAGMPATAPVP